MAKASSLKDRPVAPGRTGGAGLCLGTDCTMRVDGGMAFCPDCLELRRLECEATRADPAFAARARNYACSYGWHQLVINCPLCIKDGTYGTTGCQPCEKCHYCNSVHVRPESA